MIHKIGNFDNQSALELSKLLTSCLTTIKQHLIKYCNIIYERSGKNMFCSIKNFGEVLTKLKSRDFQASTLSTYDFSTLYTTLPHNLIKEDYKRYTLWSCQKVIEALTYLLDNIYIRFGTKI